MSGFLFIIFILLAFIHFNWARGGQWGMDQALPTKENGDRVLNPRKIDSLIVGVGLSMFAVFQLIHGGWIHYTLPYWLNTAFLYGIPVLFLLRAIGDFKYVGVFKKVKNTPFAKMDKKLYIPLCLLIAVMSGYGLWT